MHTKGWRQLRTSVSDSPGGIHQKQSYRTLHLTSWRRGLVIALVIMLVMIFQHINV